MRVHLRGLAAFTLAAMLFGLVAGCTTYSPLPLDRKAALRDRLAELDHGERPLYFYPHSRACLWWAQSSASIDQSRHHAA
jgi:hypothetical protein